MMFELLVRPVHILFTILLFAIVAAAPIVKALAKGWFYAHPLRLKSTYGKDLVQQGIRYEEIILRSADDILLSAWYTPPRDEALILVGHGYANVRPAEMHILFAKHGFGVLSWDFRAHGRSQGNLCTFGYSEALDVEAALDYALDQPDVSWIGMWGGSLGGMAAFHAASRRPEIMAIVGDSVPYNARDALRTVVKTPLLRGLLLRVGEHEMGLGVDVIRSDRWISEMSVRPVLLIQGADDQNIPADSAQRLNDAAGGYSDVWIEPGVRHLEMFEARPEEYGRRVVAFFQEARNETCKETAVGVASARGFCRTSNVAGPTPD
jgi:pimeloyl-ACP methyl ester carboxylesterase